MTGLVTLWLPPLLWMGVIFWLSSGEFSSDRTAPLLWPWLRLLLPWASDAQLEILHRGIRHSAHVVEYAILAALWFRALIRSASLRARPAGALAIAVAVVWACVDEWHQSTIPTRTASGWDVLLDATGATVATLLLLALKRTR